MIPLEKAVHYTGLNTYKTARDRAASASLPFPTFRTGDKKGKWFVNAEKLAAYLDAQDKEYTEEYVRKNT